MRCRSASLGTQRAPLRHQAEFMAPQSDPRAAGRRRREQLSKLINLEPQLIELAVPKPTRPQPAKEAGTADEEARQAAISPSTATGGA